MACIAIIPARGGSKRIPRKNLKPFLGQPVITRVIEAAKASGVFDVIMVSTDCLEIAEIARSAGAEVPYMRSPENSDDFATTADVIEEVLKRYKSDKNHFDWFACIYPVAALLSGATLSQAWTKLAASEFKSMMSVVRYGHPIQRALAIEDQGVKFISPEFRSVRTQDLPLRYHDAGQFYFGKTEEFLRNKLLIAEKCLPYELSEIECQDIDTVVDWRLAELKARLLVGEDVPFESGTSGR